MRKEFCKNGHPMSGPDADVRIYLRAAEPDRNRAAHEERNCRVCDRTRDRSIERAKARRYVDPVIVCRLVDGFPEGAVATLHERRAAMEVLLRKGHSTCETARRAGVSKRTVERYSARRAK